MPNRPEEHRDNTFLSAVGPDVVTGHVSEENGHDPEELEAFVPTTEELQLLVKCLWQTDVIAYEFFVFYYRQTSSGDSRRLCAAHHRTAQIKAIIGADAVASAIDAAYDEYGRTKDPETWRIFLHGTEDERRAVYMDVQVQMTAIDRASGEDRFYESLMKFVAGEPHDIKPGTIAMAEAERAKVFIDEIPAWAAPEKKGKLLQAIHDRDQELGTALTPARQANA